jgi:hypothetical protein
MISEQWNSRSCLSAYKHFGQLFYVTQGNFCTNVPHARWRHFDENPDEKAMKYIHALVEAIREIRIVNK